MIVGRLFVTFEAVKLNLSFSSDFAAEVFVTRTVYLICAVRSFCVNFQYMYYEYGIILGYIYMCVHVLIIIEL